MYEGRPKGLLRRALFDFTHPVSLLWDIGFTDLTEEEIDKYYRLKDEKRQRKIYGTDSQTQ